MTAGALRKPVATARELADLVPDGARIMVGGFMGAGQPSALLGALVAVGRRRLTVIATDCGLPGGGLAALIASGAVGTVVVSFLGSNPKAQAQVRSGVMAAELVPQGTLVERIRARGAGLGGVLTRTGLGTAVAAGKRTVEAGGETWLLEEPLDADFAFVACDVADALGNATYRLTAANLNPVMAMAGRLTFLEPRRIVEPGAIPAGSVATPGVFVDRIVEAPA